jgi:RNA polymerase sigma factor for flagellar operon FliA
VKSAECTVTRRRGRPRKPRDEDFDAYRRAPSIGLRNALVTRYMKCVRWNAERILKRMPESVELDDLVSAGTFGLMEAIERFDPDRGVKFETYCAPRIRGAIMDDLRGVDPIPRLARVRAKRLDAARETLTTKLNRPPADDELARHLKLSPRLFKRMLDTAAPQGQTEQSLAAVLCTNYDSGSGLTRSQVLIDRRTPRPDDDTLDGFRGLIRCLPKAMRLIVTLYHVEDMTQKEIGATMGLSESRVSQLHTQAIAILRSHHRHHVSRDPHVEANR